ncbi:D-alanyl-D-alanine carboxypeptidase/D-alanyl-D-alanine-endopeptidase [bacterium]|nr:D-alanyl-D-alanine carboxypeptidase/D-alanyl-D-alanine-endopeptidase [bacterium]
MKKILATLFILLMAQLSAHAGKIDRTIFSSGINKEAVSISVKDVSNGKTVYSLNAKAPKNPASTLKLITLSASVDTLGKDYQFSTKLYKSVNNDLYIKLGADPFLTSFNIKKLFEIAKSKNIIEPKNIYIDDSIFDNVEWGEGWQWDDDLSPYMPKFSAYNLDGNLLKIVLVPTIKAKPVEIIPDKFYPVTFMNLVTTGDNYNLKISRNTNISPDMINLEGTIGKRTEIQLPTPNPKLYFTLRVKDAIRANKVNYYGKFTSKQTPTDKIYLVGEINNSMSFAIDEILKNSNNMVAETVFKLAGAKFSSSQGNLKNSQNMLNAYLEKIGLPSNSIKIVDGSGVSKNNLVTADFMSEFLAKTYNSDITNSLAKAGEGTLSTRMLYFKDNLRAKTGTLSNVSAIAGYITARNGKVYAFDIMINDPKSTSQEKKTLEEYILRDIYELRR